MVNKKMIIHEMNTSKLNFIDFKKRIYIDNDVKLIKILVEIVTMGIKSLQLYSVCSKYSYLVTSLQYLGILYNKYPEERDRIDIEINNWKEDICQKLDTLQKYKNLDYYKMLKDILNEMDFLNKQNIIEKEIDSYNKQKDFSIFEWILGVIRNSDSIDILKIENDFNTYLVNNVFNFDSFKQYDKIKKLQKFLKNKRRVMKKDSEKKIIDLFFNMLKVYFYEIEKTNKEKVVNYLTKDYPSQFDHSFRTWNISSHNELEQPFIITIDDICSLDLDDALSVTKDLYGMTLHVYIANTNPFLYANPEFEAVALRRYSSLYFSKDIIYHMLPKNCAENYLSLKEQQVRNVIDHSFYLDHSGNVSYNVTYKTIAVNKRLSYDQVDEMIRKKSQSDMRDYLTDLEKCIQLIYKKMNLNTKYVINDESRAQKIVSSSAILVNHITALEAIKKQYLLLYQDYCSGEYLLDIKDNPYVKVTSPIRRYSDLKNNYLLQRFIENNISDSEYYQIENELKSIIPILGEEKERNKQYSKMLYFGLKFE